MGAAYIHRLTIPGIMFDRTVIKFFSVVAIILSGVMVVIGLAALAFGLPSGPEVFYEYIFIAVSSFTLFLASVLVNFFIIGNDLEARDLRQAGIVVYLILAENILFYLISWILACTSFLVLAYIMTIRYKHDKRMKESQKKSGQVDGFSR